MLSIMFSVIPKSDFAKFYIFEKRKAAKDGFLYDSMSGKWITWIKNQLLDKNVNKKTKLQ